MQEKFGHSASQYSTVPLASSFLRLRQTGHPLQTLLSRRHGFLVGLLVVCSTLIILVQVVSYNDKGSLYQAIIKGDTSLQGLLQQGDFLSPSKNVVPSSPSKNAQVVIANVEKGAGSSTRIPNSAKIISNQFPMLSLTQNAERLTNAMLKMYKIVPPSQVQRVLIVSYFRSGSTFLGDILQSPLQTFYTFEPFHFTRRTRLRSNDFDDFGCAKLIRGLLKCDFRLLPDYMAWVTMTRNQFLIRHNQFFWKHCALKNNLCFDANFIESMCHRSPLQVVKMVRVPLRYAVKFVTEEPAFVNSTAIVHLIRDPRAIMASRRRLDWCKDDCVRPEALCSQISEDLATFEETRRKHPEVRLVQIKLEDLATDPFAQTKALFANLGIKFTRWTEAFLKTHTKHGSSDPYSTRRNSATVAYDWLRRLSLKDILDIQTHCESTLSLAKYDTVEMGHGNKFVNANNTQWPAVIPEDSQFV